MHVNNRDAILALLEHLGTNGKYITAYDVEQAKRALAGEATQLRPFELARLNLGEFYSLHFGPNGQIVVISQAHPAPGGCLVSELVGIELVVRHRTNIAREPIVRFQYQHQNPEALSVMWREERVDGAARWHIIWGEVKAYLPWEAKARHDTAPRTDPPILFVNGDGLYVAANVTCEGVQGVGVCELVPSKNEIPAVPWHSFYPPINGADRAHLKFVYGFGPVIEHVIDNDSPGASRSFVQWVDWKSHEYPTAYGAAINIFERGGEPAVFYWTGNAAHLDGLRGYKKNKTQPHEQYDVQAGNLIRRNLDQDYISVTDVRGEENVYSLTLNSTSMPSVTKQGDALVIQGEINRKNRYFFVDGKKITELTESGKFFHQRGLYGWVNDNDQMVVTTLLERLPALMKSKDNWMPAPCWDGNPPELTPVTGRDGRTYAMAVQDIGHGQVSIFRFPVR